MGAILYEPEAPDTESLYENTFETDRIETPRMA